MNLGLTASMCQTMVPSGMLNVHVELLIPVRNNSFSSAVSRRQGLAWFFLGVREIPGTIMTRTSDCALS